MEATIHFQDEISRFQCSSISIQNRFLAIISALRGSYGGTLDEIRYFKVSLSIMVKLLHVFWFYLDVFLIADNFITPGVITAKI